MFLQLGTKKAHILGFFGGSSAFVPHLSAFVRVCYW